MVQRTNRSNHCTPTVEQLAKELGFGLVGVTDARLSDHAEAVRRWIAAGKHGEMGYLADRLEIRLDPTRLLEGAQSIIAVADAYPSKAMGGDADAAGGGGAGGASQGDSPRGRIARYAWGRDYHKVIKKRLHTLADTLGQRYGEAAFRCVVDTAPALEREHAVRAGLGWTGKHTLLIHPRFGSYFLLGLIVTTLPLASLDPVRESGASIPMPDHCGTCTRCIDACPTQCIEATAERGSSRSVDAKRCISYLTLEHRSVIDETLHPMMGDWLAGCDVCQEVCPYNQRAERSDIEAQVGQPPVHRDYAPRSLAEGLPLLEVLGWTAEDRQRAFTGSALKRIKLDMLKRNALIAMGNYLTQVEDAAARQRVEAIATDEEEAALVRETARQVLARVG